jgi:thioester reductase-like protein
MASVFLTGFPGFLGSRLVERIISRTAADMQVNCLVQAAYRPLAEYRIQQIEAAIPEATGRIHLYNGDITKPTLGLTDADYQALAAGCVEVYHLAAIYDLAVKREIGMAVNVDGTRHMLQFAAQAGDTFRRFQYVSTCYVSGKYAGTFTENDLIKGQDFNNYYEETKYLAEVAVQEAMQDGFPVTIYRPSIVVGDSDTGATQKYDGLYYIIQFLLRQPLPVAALPVVGDPTRFEANFVPSNYVIDAIAHLSKLEKSEGVVYHLSDPQSLYVDEVIDLVAQATGRSILRVPVPGLIAKNAMKHIPGVQQITGIEPEAMNYFTQPTRYTCDNTLRDLDGSGIVCPPLGRYLTTLVEYMKAHPEFSSKAMV